MLFHPSDGLDLTLSSVQARESWEKAFDEAYIKPVVEPAKNSSDDSVPQDLDAKLQKAQQTIMDQDTAGMN